MADDEYEEELELADEFDSDFNDEVVAFPGLWCNSSVHCKGTVLSGFSASCCS